MLVQVIKNIEFHLDKYILLPSFTLLMVVHLYAILKHTNMIDTNTYFHYLHTIINYLIDLKSTKCFFFIIIPTIFTSLVLHSLYDIRYRNSDINYSRVLNLN